MPRFHKENTIQSQSAIYFTTPSEMAREKLFYVQMYGHFVCDRRYSVLGREPFESFLIMRTLGGSGTLITPNGEYRLKTGNVALVDCSCAHDYYADDFWEFQWFHFYGSASDSIVRQILERAGNVITQTDDGAVSRNIALIAEKKGDLSASLDDEIMVSALIHEILAGLLLLGKQDTQVTHATGIAQAVRHIQQQYKTRITVDGLAAMLGMSNSSFSHRFKAETGFSPYDYLINYRINQAKYMLWACDWSINEISERVGFSSTANFIKKFREKTGMTPYQFRSSQQISVR